MNIQLEYEMIRSKTMAKQAERAFLMGKEFGYEHVQREKVVKIKKDTDTLINPQRRSLKALLWNRMAGAPEIQKNISSQI